MTDPQGSPATEDNAAWVIIRENHAEVKRERSSKSRPEFDICIWYLTLCFPYDIFP
jgi:hypothetical protein